MWIFNGTSIITLILVCNFLSSTWVTVFKFLNFYSFFRTADCFSRKITNFKFTSQLRNWNCLLNWFVVCRRVLLIILINLFSMCFLTQIIVKLVVSWIKDTLWNIDCNLVSFLNNLTTNFFLRIGNL